MQRAVFKFFILAIFIAVSLRINAQSCNGSLGDPVINQDFGSGLNPGAPLATGITNMFYTASNCPNDGYYTIANSLVGYGNCHSDTWLNVVSDHTGNPNGYMMIVNASNQPNVFFTQAANGLCPNTTYEFSAYILNLIMDEALTAGFSEPDINFSIQTTGGQTLATFNTGTIPPSKPGTLPWTQYGVFFTTPANVTDVVVVMSNLAPGGDGNDFILDDITFRACGPLIEAGFGANTGPDAIDLCQGNSAQYTIDASVMANGNPQLQWQSNTNNSAWVDITGQTTNSLTVPFTNAVTGTYQYRLGVSNGSDISSVQCRVYSTPITVNVNPLPVVPSITPQTVCDGYPLQLSASGGAAYIWSGPNLAPTSQNPLIINNATSANAGIYTVQVSSNKNCLTTTQTAVTVVPKVVATISGNTTICAGTPAQLTAGGGLYYKWTPATGLDNANIANPVATPLQTTTYVAHVSNGGCSDSTESVTVTVMQNPVANAGTNKTIFEGQSVKLDGTVVGDNVFDYYWTPTTGLNDPTSLTPIAAPDNNTTYTLTAISQSCGTSTSSIFVRVYKKVTIPNTFSPNNDGINDNWDIDALATYPECSVLVYDRYGQKVYESTGYAKPWDGTINSSPLPQGTYYYIIDLKNNTPKLAGWVLVVR